MPRPPPSDPRPAWRDAERKAYLLAAAAGLCVRCRQPVALTRYGRPGVLCAQHRDDENARKARRRAGLPALELPPPNTPRAPREPRRTSRASQHRRRDLWRARRRALAARARELATAGVLALVPAPPAAVPR